MRPEFPAAGLFRRLAAGFYDLLILAGVLVVTSFVVILARGGEAIPAGNRVYQGFLAAQLAGYFIGFWARAGQTPGMRAWHLRLQTARGGTPSLAMATVRFAAALLSAAPFGLGFLWMVHDARSRTWHDRLSGTRVIRISGMPAE